MAWTRSVRRRATASILDKVKPKQALPPSILEGSEKESRLESLTHIPPAATAAATLRPVDGPGRRSRDRAGRRQYLSVRADRSRADRRGEGPRRHHEPGQQSARYVLGYGDHPQGPYGHAEAGAAERS